MPFVLKTFSGFTGLTLKNRKTGAGPDSYRDSQVRHNFFGVGKSKSPLLKTSVIGSLAKQSIIPVI